MHSTVIDAGPRLRAASFDDVLYLRADDVADFLELLLGDDAEGLANKLRWPELN